MEVTNGFKGLDLIERVPEELWTEVCDTVYWDGMGREVGGGIRMGNTCKSMADSRQ